MNALMGWKLVLSAVDEAVEDSLSIQEMILEDDLFAIVVKQAKAYRDIMLQVATMDNKVLELEGDPVHNVLKWIESRRLH